MREGYKQTEVGVIPEDWCVTTLGTLGPFSKGSGVKKAEANSGELNCIRYGELYTKHHDVIKEFHSKISLEVALTSKLLKFGDILFACSGETKEEIGKCAAFVSKKNAYAGGDIIILSPQKDDPIFLGYLLNSPKVSSQKAKTGQGDAVVHTNASALSNITIPLPNLGEQQAIASTLSDVDGLIASLEALIAKKRALKTATMQQLLTGKTRLDGFGVGKGMKQTELGKIPEDWDMVPLGSIGAFKNGINKSANEFGFGSPFVNLMDIFGIPSISTEQGLGLLNSTPFEQTLYSMEKGDVLFVRSSVKPSGVGLTSLVKKDLKNTVFSGFIIRYRNDSISTEYKEHCFHEDGFRKRVIAASTSSANTNINQNNLSPIPIALPSCHKEQKAIAEGLSTIDESIIVLKEKLSKTKALKQGMMQELLTGRTRLV